MAGEGREDDLCWVETKSGTFFIKSLYILLETNSLVQFLVGIVWNVSVPPKLSFFALEAT